MTLETAGESATATLRSKVPALDVDTPFCVPSQLVASPRFASLLATPYLASEVAPSAPEYLPVGQPWQLLAPEEGPKVFTGQSVQVGDPAASL